MKGRAEKIILESGTENHVERDGKTLMKNGGNSGKTSLSDLLESMRSGKGGGSVPKQKGQPVRVYDPSVKFISLSNSMNVRTVRSGRFAFGG